MSDINAAPSRTEPANEAAKTDMQEAGTATAGESTGSGVDLNTQTNSGENSISMSGQSIGDRSLDSLMSVSLSSESPPPVAGSLGSGDAPAVAQSGEGVEVGESAAIATSPSNAAASVDAGTEAVDAGNAGASPAAGQSASDTASSAQDASQGDDTAADVSRAEIDAAHAQLVAARLQIAAAHELIANLQQQLTDEQTEVAKWQAAYNASTATRVPGEPPAAHRWVSLLEGKLTALENEARDELLDVARQLREAL